MDSSSSFTGAGVGADIEECVVFGYDVSTLLLKELLDDVLTSLLEVLLDDVMVSKSSATTEIVHAISMQNMSHSLNILALPLQKLYASFKLVKSKPQDGW
ncbi:hypothetical protein KXD40_008536 [Peronospora effusa]|uniref:Uncharacterized protein n=1 Tax=Peronospora effusa TaxID=542832 RepID=A0A3M6VST5_9STRA|nr:hypothetical protein DD238_005950 [Peronospora effusa]RQM17920.1 hypothetical protein DD237_002638 [Peronospora effusa]UIZ24321.1 hypothetical protein KXD40_008536 [Peronospora effusa]CAI5729114.1 unnamed protein product [Peronospora effusa]